MSEAICGADSAPGWRFAYPGYEQTRLRLQLRRARTRHRPVFCPAPGLAGHPVPHLPRRGVRNDRAFHRARGARMCWHAGSPHAACAAHGQWSSPTPKIVELNRASEADLRLRSARGWIFRLAACPRGCRWRRRAPVRASCRPDMHLDRPPVLPASVPVRFLGICDPHCVQGPASLRPSASRCHVSKTIATRPSPERDAIDDISPISKIKNKIRTSANYFSENQKFEPPPQVVVFGIALIMRARAQLSCADGDVRSSSGQSVPQRSATIDGLVEAQA